MKPSRAYRLWAMDVHGDARLVAERPYVMQLLNEVAAPLQKYVKKQFLYVQVLHWDASGLPTFSYPWNWVPDRKGGHKLPKGNLCHSVRRMLRQAYRRRE